MIYHNKFGINSNKIIVGIHGWGGTNNTFLPIQKKLNDDFILDFTMYYCFPQYTFIEYY